jgi:carbamoyltransferase
MKPTYILGISAFYHDSVACLVRDGEIVDAAPEDGLNRIEHAQRLPVDAESDRLEQDGITGAALLPVAFYYAPL